MKSVATYHEEIEKVLSNIRKVIIGKDDIATLSIVALLAQGHVLIEDVPGVGKTMLVRSIARSIDGEFKRIQFTPDLLPSDITGMSIYNPKQLEFEFRPGPILGNIILADEINRTSPKTQSALLEAMEENSVTVDGGTIQVQQPFFVMATQNPIEYEGTYPLSIGCSLSVRCNISSSSSNVGYPIFNIKINRSSCASGSGYVPSYSIGFCVAMTKNGC